MKKWEYKTITLKDYDADEVFDEDYHSEPLWEKKLTHLGQDGWELVSVIQSVDADNLVALLKREIGRD